MLHLLKGAAKKQANWCGSSEMGRFCTDLKRGSMHR